MIANNEVMKSNFNHPDSTNIPHFAKFLYVLRIRHSYPKRCTKIHKMKRIDGWAEFLSLWKMVEIVGKVPRERKQYNTDFLLTGNVLVYLVYCVTNTLQIHTLL